MPGIAGNIRATLRFRRVKQGGLRRAADAAARATSPGGPPASGVDKVAAWELKLSVKAVEGHRINLLHKMGAQSPVDMVRMVGSCPKAGHNPRHCGRSRGGNHCGGIGGPSLVD